MTLYKNKYRVESARLKNWDYSTPGYYFVTICAYQRECFFGDVVNGEMRLSPAGEIVADEWMKTESIRPNVKMDVWVIMPNHVHGIIIITHRVGDDHRRVETLWHNVSTNNAQSDADASKNNPSRLKRNSLGSIVGQIKIQCTKRIRASGIAEFDWQERFWDEILWDEKSLANVRRYIETNPANWERDREKSVGLWM